MSNKWLNCIGLLTLALLAACSESSVGDPCIPERVPAGGFLPSETYLETNSIQCATRVCLVQGLAGDPNNVEVICEEDDESCDPDKSCPLDCNPDECEEEGCCDDVPSTCVTQSEIDESVYCSVRCDAPDDGAGAPTQKCPSGFTCEVVLETGAEGRRGSYCIKIPE